MTFIQQLKRKYKIKADATDLENFHIKKILRYPDTRQGTNYTCGAMSIQSVLYYYGIEVREDKLIDIFGAKPTHIIHSGIDPDEIKSKLEQIWGLQTTMKPMTIDEVKDYIDREIPVILAIQAWRGEDNATDKTDYRTKYRDGHYVVAIGYTDHSMIFDDPSILANRAYLTFDELNERWHDIDYQGNIYDHLGIAVYGKAPVYDPNVIKKIL